MGGLGSVYWVQRNLSISRPRHGDLARRPDLARAIHDVGERQVAEPIQRRMETRTAAHDDTKDEAREDIREQGADRIPAGLVATKLVPPPPRARMVARQRLLDSLDGVLRKRLALLSAPPGSGKTTLLADWLERARCTVAWVALDAGDDDPTGFWLATAAALEHARPGSASGILALLGSAQPPSSRAVLAALLNALCAVPGELVLVLDDYHCIADASIHDGVSYLVDHLPPHVHLVLASRSDPPLPLSRWRVRDELVELCAEDLGFTTDECACFLRETMTLQLTEEQIALLRSRTEGWVAGLQLAALSLRGQRDIAAFLDQFAGSHRYIVDYLADEVLDRQPPHIRDFLLRTAPLDQLSGPLCDAVTLGSESQALLLALERANLFLIPQDHERRWFRYHALFREVLCQRLRATFPGEIAELHARASAWLERKGMLHAAVTHALSAGETERAATLVEQMAETLWKRSQIAPLRALLDALPDDVVRARPKLCLFHCWIGLMAGKFAAGRDRLADAERAIDMLDERCPDAERDTLYGALFAIQANLARVDGKYREAESLAHRTLDLVSDDQTMWRSIAALNLVQVAWALGDHVAARQAVAEATRMSERGGDDFGTVTALLAAGGIEEDLGRLHLAADLLRRGLRRYQDRGSALPPMAGYLIAELANISYEWDALDEAERLARESIEIGRMGEVFDIYYNGLLILARIHQARGDRTAALSTILEAERLLDEAPLPALNADVAAWAVELRMAQGDLDAAAAWTRATVDARPEPEKSSLYTFGPLTLLPRALLATGHADEALERLHGIVAEAERLHQMGPLIRALAAQSLALQAMDRPSEARVVLLRALALGEGEEYIRTFADLGAPMTRLLAELAASTAEVPVGRAYLTRVIAACPSAASAPTAGVRVIGEPVAGASAPDSTDASDLSEREREVLRLMAAGAANQTIADTLVVSIHTVKTHVAHILAKLHAANRTEAVARARELRLV